MSAQALPDPSAPLPPRSSDRNVVSKYGGGGVGRPRAIDFSRLVEFNRRRAAGEKPLEAWLAIITDVNLGTRDHRGARAVSVAQVGASLMRFLDRVEPGSVRTAQQLVRMEAAELTSKMLHVVSSIANGVDDGSTIKPADRIAAARTVLQVGGTLQNGSAGGAKTAVQINNVNGPSEHATAAALANDPVALKSAIDAARRITPQVTDSAAS